MSINPDVFWGMKIFTFLFQSLFFIRISISRMTNRSKIRSMGRFYFWSLLFHRGFSFLFVVKWMQYAAIEIKRMNHDFVVIFTFLFVKWTTFLWTLRMANLVFFPFNIYLFIFHQNINHSWFFSFNALFRTFWYDFCWWNVNINIDDSISFPFVNVLNFSYPVRR